MQVANRNREVRTIIILAVLCLVLQLAIAPNVALGSGRANFALIFTACVALISGGGTAVVGGFVSGLLFDLSSTGPIGLMAFCLTLMGYVLGVMLREQLAGDPVAILVHVGMCALVVSLAYHLAMLLVGATSSFVDTFVYRALPTALLTFVFFLPFAYVFGRMRARSTGLGGRHASGSLTRRGL